MRDDEIRVRVLEHMKPRTFRFGSALVDDLQAQIASAAAALNADASDRANLERTVRDATAVVDEAIADRSFRKRFRGKGLIHGLLRSLALHNVSYNDFLYALADACSSSRNAQREIGRAFARLDSARVARLEALVTQNPDGDIAPV